MKKLLLCGLAIFALSFTSNANADTVLLNDDITDSTYLPLGPSSNGWGNTLGTVIYNSVDNGYLSSSTVTEANASRNLATPGTNDTQLEALFFGRFRAGTDATNTFKTMISLTDGTNTLAFGTDAAGDYLSGSALTLNSYNEQNDPFSAGEHSYNRLRLIFDDTTDQGTLFSAVTNATDGLGTVINSSSEQIVATFTSNLDISALESLTVLSGHSSDRIGAINVRTITAVPEPGTVGLSLMCLAGLAARRRRR